MSPFEPKTSQESLPLSTELPFDPDIVQGTLSNGLRYYIRHNTRPQGRAEIRLVVNVGSILEDDDQRGLAHIVEHMAFNGSKNFASGELVQYFESIGARFGAHLNAQTSFDNTIYKLHIPTEKEEIMDQSLLVLQDWASSLLFLPKEIERERKVGLEEWRQHRGAYARLRERLSPMLYHKSLYADRLTIGTEESLNTFTHEALKRFYLDWYRPNLMSVVVVGDVDVEQVEQKIQNMFSGLKNPQVMREPHHEKLCTHKESFGLVMQDSELSHRSFCILSKKPKKLSRTHEDLLEELVANLAFRAANERLSFMAQQQNAPFLGAKLGSDELNKVMSTDVFSAALPVENTQDCIERCYREVLRFQRFGITEAELKRAKKSHLSTLEAMYQEKDTTHSRVLSSEIVQHVTDGEVLLGLDFDYAFGTEHTDAITREQVNTFLSTWLSPHNRVQYLITPDEDHPSSEEFQTWIAETSIDEEEAPQEEEESKPLMEHRPKPGHIVSKKHIPELELEEWILSNGAKVWIKKTPFQKDRILFSSFSFGGRSLLPTEDIHSSKMTTACVRRSGVGDHSLMELQKILSGATVQLLPFIKNSEHGFQGVSTVNHIETLFQLHYLFVTQPRLDEDMFLRELEIARSHFHNRLSDPQVQMHDAFQKLYWQDHPRKQPWNSERLDSVSREVCQKQFSVLFHSASTHYVLVGNIDFDILEEYVQTYVASLPSIHEHSVQSWDLHARREAACSYIYAGKEPSATYHMSCFVEGSFDRRDRMHNNVLQAYIQLMLRRRLREEMGAVYSVQVQSRSIVHPEEGCHFSIDFSCDPERLEELKSVLNEILQELPRQEASKDDIDNVIEQLSNQFDMSIQENGGWIQYLLSSAKRGEDLRAFMDTPTILRSITPDSLKSYWHRIYDVQRLVELMMLPEAEESLVRG